MSYVEFSRNDNKTSVAPLFAALSILYVDLLYYWVQVLWDLLVIAISFFRAVQLSVSQLSRGPASAD